MHQENYIIEYLKGKHYDSAVKAISELYHEMLYWYIRKLVKRHQDADDVLQNTYVRIFKGLKSFGFRSSVKTWCFRMAHNESMRLLQTKRNFNIPMVGVNYQIASTIYLQIPILI